MAYLINSVAHLSQMSVNQKEIIFYCQCGVWLQRPLCLPLTTCSPRPGVPWSLSQPFWELLGWGNVTLAVESAVWIFIFSPAEGHETGDGHMPNTWRWVMPGAQSSTAPYHNWHFSQKFKFDHKHLHFFKQVWSLSASASLLSVRLYQRRTVGLIIVHVDGCAKRLLSWNFFLFIFNWLSYKMTSRWQHLQLQIG